MRMPRMLAASVLTAFALLTLAWSQSATTSLRGTVADAKGAVLQGASVTLSDPQTGFTRSVKTDDQGVYQFLQLPPATYVITVSATGFANLKEEGVRLLVNTPATQNFTMEVKGEAIVVEVTGAAPLVNTTDATLGHAFGTEKIQNLPFEGRDPVGILSL